MCQLPYHFTITWSDVIKNSLNDDDDDNNNNNNNNNNNTLNYIDKKHVLCTAI
jgi:hypothetical protein